MQDEEEFEKEIQKIAKRKPTLTHQRYRCGHCSRKYVTLGKRFQKHHAKHHPNKTLKARYL